MDMLIIIIFWLIAEIAGTIAGFGSSSIFLPLVSWILDFHNALLLVAIYHIFGNFSRLSLFYKHINTKILLLFGIPSIILTVIWASLAAQIDQVILKTILGVVLASFASYALWKPKRSVKPTKLFGIIGGGLSGLTAWLVGTGGVLRGAFMTMFVLPKEQYIATIATVALIVDFTRIPIYFGNGFLDQSLWILIPILLVVAFAWSWIGKRIVSKISEEIFRKIILSAIIVLSLVFVFQWLLYFL